MLVSNEKAGELMGWKPEFGNQDCSHRRPSKTIDWFNTPDNMSRYKSTIYNV